MMTLRITGFTLAMFISLGVLNGAELLGYYEFEDNYEDSSGNGNTAEESQNPDELSFSDDGFRGKALDINDPDSAGNSGGSVDIPIDVNPFELPGVTFGGWLNVEEFEFDGFMAIDNGGWDRGITVGQDNLGFGIASGAGPTNIGEIAPGEWQFVVGTFDQDEDISTIYVGNADAANPTTISGTSQDTTGEGEPVIEIGRYDNQDLDARVDDIFVFDSALDAHQVNAIRNLRLANTNYTPRQAAELFALFADGEEGEIAGSTWKPASGLPAAIPGALIDNGDEGVGLVLDDAGNGMVGPAGLIAETDSDEDGMDDFWEETNFGNLDRNGEGDFDEDGLSDLEEFAKGTNPKVIDTDGDGLADGDEVQTYNTNPANPDTDGDGWNDGAEIAADPPTDPNDPASFPKLPALPLLAYYEFEDNFEDSSGLGNTAKAEQNPDEVTFVEGFRGMGADINDPTEGENNSGGSINIPVDANPSELPAVSFGGWINVETFEFDGFMAIDNGGWDRGITVGQDQLGYGIASGAGPANIGEITPGEWQYVVGTFDDEQDVTALYVGDASPQNQTTETAEGSDAGDTEGELEIEIGRYDNQDLDAIVDDIFVFGGALSAHEANAIRNLRLSGLDYSPRDAAELFELFSNEESGVIGQVSWLPASGLAADTPGKVDDVGGAFTVVLDDAGNGMMTGVVRLFQITSVKLGSAGENRTVTLTWTSQNRKTYALDASPTLAEWIEVDDGIESGGTETTYIDSSPVVTADKVRYYRVREVQ